MASRTKREAITADASLAQAKKTSSVLKKLLLQHQGQHGSRGHGGESVREDSYKGHHIVIKTTYEIQVDGKTFNAPLHVSNAGDVGYHGMPNVGFPSAIDLVRSVIDQFPDEFAPKGKPKALAPSARKRPSHDHGGHDEDAHNHAGHDEHAPTSKNAAKRLRPKKAGR